MRSWEWKSGGSPLRNACEASEKSVQTKLSGNWVVKDRMAKGPSRGMGLRMAERSRSQPGRRQRLGKNILIKRDP